MRKRPIWNKDKKGEQKQSRDRYLRDGKLFESKSHADGSYGKMKCVSIFSGKQKPAWIERSYDFEVKVYCSMNNEKAQSK